MKLNGQITVGFFDLRKLVADETSRRAGVAVGPYNVHFMLRDGVVTCTVDIPPTDLDERPPPMIIMDKNEQFGVCKAGTDCECSKYHIGESDKDIRRRLQLCGFFVASEKP